jgi:FkbM family methyltransferase
MLNPKKIIIFEKIPLVRRFFNKYLESWFKKNSEKDFKSKIVGGSLMLLRVNDWVQKNLFLYGIYEKKEIEFWMNFVKNKNVIFDIGANVGYFSIVASKLVDKKEGIIYSFEPISHTYDRAYLNIKLNGYTNINLFKKAISDKNDKIEINIGNAENWGMSSITNHDYLSGKTEVVETISLDSFVEQYKIKNIDIIKIDIEGSEIFAIKGMQSVLSKIRPVILIEILENNLSKVNSSKEEIFEIFYSNKYTPYLILSNLVLQKIKEPIYYDGLICFYPNEKEIPNSIISCE